MTLVLAIWNQKKGYIGSEGRLNRGGGGILSEKLQKIIIDKNKNIAVAPHGNWSVPNCEESIRVVVENFIKSDESHSISEFTENLNQKMKADYSFMSTGFIIIGNENNNVKRYNIKEDGQIIELPEIGLSFNSEKPFQIPLIIKHYQIIFRKLFHREYTDYDFYNNLSSENFSELISKTILSVSNDNSISDQIGNSIDIFEISNTGIVTLKNENEIKRKISDFE